LTYNSLVKQAQRLLV